MMREIGYDIREVSRGVELRYELRLRCEHSEDENPCAVIIRENSTVSLWEDGARGRWVAVAPCADGCDSIQEDKWNVESSSGAIASAYKMALVYHQSGRERSRCINITPYTPIAAKEEMKRMMEYAIAEDRRRVIAKQLDYARASVAERRRTDG